jgi:hypothetical protein
LIQDLLNVRKFGVPPMKSCGSLGIAAPWFVQAVDFDAGLP